MKIPTLAPPRGFQFRLGTLLLAIVWVALVCMGLQSASEPWSGILFILAAGSMLLAALMSIYRTGRTRAFALGFLVFGGWYTFLSSGDHNYDDPNTARPDLLTTRGAIALFSRLHGDDVQTTAQTFISALSTPNYVYSTPSPVIPAANYQVVNETTMLVPAGSPAPPGVAIPAGMTSQPVRVVTRVTKSQAVSLSTFLSVAHNSLLMLLGLIGGITAQYLYATRRDDDSAAMKLAQRHGGTEQKAT